MSGIVMLAGVHITEPWTLLQSSSVFGRGLSPWAAGFGRRRIITRTLRLDSKRVCCMGVTSPRFALLPYNARDVLTGTLAIRSDTCHPRPHDNLYGVNPQRMGVPAGIELLRAN